MLKNVFVKILFIYYIILSKRYKIKINYFDLYGIDLLKYDIFRYESII